MNINWKVICVYLTLVVLASCGGSGGSAPSTPASSGDSTGGDTTDGDSSSGGSAGGDTTGGDSSGGDSSGGDSSDGGTTDGGITGGDTTGGDSPVTTQPNILLIISDDQGLDASAQYSLGTDLPVTPTLNQLASDGIVFDNMWVTPACSTTRATMITGKYGINNGVNSLPGNLSTEHQTLQSYLGSNPATQGYESAVFGKWHIGIGAGDNHPSTVGIEHYAGNLSNVNDYFNWELTTNGVTQTSSEYHTTKITDLSLEWINQQTSPWFAWVAYSAPHSPFHLPPQQLHSRNLSGTADDINNNRRAYYLAAIEAMDAEIGRMLTSIPQDVLDNTIVIFIGDNGTPRGVLDTSTYPNGHNKGTLYQGGVAVPFVVSGKGVNRQNVRENTLITATDLYATIAELAGMDTTQIHDSQSFARLLSSENSLSRDFIYTGYQSSTVDGWTVRSADYKLIEMQDGSQELFALSDFTESTNLINSSDELVQTARQNLEAYANTVVNDTPATTNGIDITNAILTNKSQNCADYVEMYTSTVNDVNNGTIFMGDLSISVVADKCVFTTNAIPNHDFNDGGDAFPNDVSAQNDRFEVTSSPSTASETTELTLGVDNAIMLNGVKVDLLAAGCFGIGNGKVGCNDMSTPWRFDPMHPANGFRVDSHNAHAQPDGTYHYHGSPFALFADDSSQASPVIGFAADGYPIFGSYFESNGMVRKAASSYRLKAGSRPSGEGQPGGNYDGAFRDDYEYVPGIGDLDECNGMLLDGVYGYYITDNYPYVLGCFSGTPDPSFTK